jgi:signal transduction histidine kinase
MTITGVVLLVPLFAGGVLNLLFYYVARDRSDVPGAGSFKLASLATAGLCIGKVLLLLSQSFTMMVVLDMITAICSVFSVFFYFMFVVEYTGHGHWLTPKRLALLWSQPAAYLLLYLTNPLHYQYVTGWKPASMVGLSFVIPSFTPLALLQLPIPYILILANIALLTEFALRSRNTYQKQTALILASSIFTMGGLLLGFVILGAKLAVTAAPIFFALRTGITALALFKHDFLDVVPLASDRIIEEMEDPVLVLDTEGVLIDYNQRAQEIFELDDASVGEQLSGQLSDVVEAVDKSRPVTVDVEARSGGGQQQQVVYQPTRTDLTDQHGITRGELLVLRDVTLQKRREAKLQAREQDLELLKQVQSRVLRHNIRNDLQVIRGRAQMIAADESGRTATHAAEIIDEVEELAQTTQKAHRLGNVIDNSDDQFVQDVSEVVELVAEQARDQFPDATITADVPETARVMAQSDLQAAIWNLTENAIVHCDKSVPEVELTVSTAEATVSLFVTDNGPGIPSHEIEVLEQQTERALQHGSGAGLWLANWVAETSGGSLAFDATGPGTTVYMRLPTADHTFDNLVDTEQPTSEPEPNTPAQAQ